jgi:two-component sensor histidine kinase
MKGRLLYIDDDDGLCRLVQKRLTEGGYYVQCAADGAAGLATLLTDRFDLVLLDHDLPGGDGLSILAEIRDRPAPPPVIFVTGADDTRVAIAALKAGASDYVIKGGGADFTELLRAAVEQALEAEELRRAKADAEAAVRIARDRAEALLKEVNHRVGNSLQLAASFVALQARTVEGEDARQALEATKRRLEAIAQVHRRLYTSEDVSVVDLQDYLEGVVEQLRASLESDESGVQVRLDCAPARLPPDQAVAVGVIVNELVTNAAKYAYPDGAGGEIRVRLEGDNGALRQLVVEDDGIGLADGVAPKGGLGQRIIAAMAASLNAQVEIDPTARGTRLSIVL